MSLTKKVILIVAVLSLASVLCVVGEKTLKKTTPMTSDVLSSQTNPVKPTEIPQESVSNTSNTAVTPEILKRKFGFSIEIPKSLRYIETEVKNPELSPGNRYEVYSLEIQDPTLKKEGVFDVEKGDYVLPEYGGVFMFVSVTDKSKNGTLGDMHGNAPNGMDYATVTPVVLGGLRGEKFEGETSFTYSVTDGNYQYDIYLWEAREGGVTPEMNKKFEDIVRTITFSKIER